MIVHPSRPPRLGTPRAGGLRWGAPLAALCGLLLLAAPAQAETYIGIDFGVAFPHDPKADRRVGFPGGRISFDERIELDPGVAVAAKVGHSFTTALPFDIGPEFGILWTESDAKFRRTRDRGELNLIALTVSAVARVTLGETAVRPHGLFQLYGGIGLGPFVAEFDGRGNSRQFSDTAAQLGFQIQMGAKFFVAGPVALYFEYRILQSLPFEWRDNVLNTSQRFETELTMHILSFGVAIHF